MALPTNAKSVVFLHFDVPKQTDSAYKAKCKYCNVCISATGKTTSNLIKHMQRKHAEKLTMPVKQKVEELTITSFVDKSKKYSSTDAKQKAFIHNISIYVAESLHAFSVVESEAFRKLISDLDPRIVCPSRRHLSTTLIPDVSANIHRKIVTLLETTTNVAVTVDLWSNRQMRSFIGITVHFISNWTLQAAVLACKRFTGRHTADNIAAQYDEVLNEFHITEKVSHVISDNASNMVKAFSLPGYNNVTEDSDDTDTENGDTSVKDGHNDMFMYLQQHNGCFAHTIQLVVKDGMKAAGGLRSVIGKASNIVAHVRKSTISTDLLEGHRKLQAANATRWNSEITMIRSLLRIPQKKLDELDTAYKLSHHDQILLGELCEILAPFEAATDYTQGDKVVTASLVIPSVRGLRSQIEELHTKYNCKMVEALLASIDSRLRTYEEQTCFQLAAILDPRFKLDWCSSKDEAEVYHKRLQTAAERGDRVAPVDEPQPALSASPPPRKRCKLFNFMGQTETARRSTSCSADEIAAYLSEPCIPEGKDPINYWETVSDKHPILSQLALKFLIIPATSAPVERLFSVAGKVFRPDRCRLTDHKFEALMFIKCNKPFH